MKSRVYGAALGLVNTAVIALGIAVRERGGEQAFVALLILGSFIGVPAGIAIGSIARRTAHSPVPARLIAIIAPAFFIVTVFGTLARFDAYIALAFLPTIAAAMILERKTRAPEVLPVAQRITGAR